MADDNLITYITGLVIQKTVNQKIPTAVFLSDTGKTDLVKNIIQTIKGGNRNELTYTSDDWKKVIEIMQTLAEIPLLIKETSDINEIKTETENFIKEMNTGEGLVIINSEKAEMNRFTTKENISIIII